MKKKTVKVHSLNKKKVNEQKINSSEKKSLASSELFAENVSVNTDRMYPMLVMATMSSGKSTLINALLGEHILPNKNEACTSKIYSIVDDDTATKSRVYVTHNNGLTDIKDVNIGEAIETANNDETVSHVLISGHVSGVLNTDKALLIIDTPGPNNSQNIQHGKTTEDVLNNIYGGLIVYVINATQMGINDDRQVLDLLKKQLEKAPNTNVIFALNKIDQVDEEKESVEGYIEEVKKYLEENGITSPIIIPVSALAALIFKKVLNNVELTRSEYRAFCEYYDLFRPKSYSLKAYAITDKERNPFEMIEVRGHKYKVSDILLAIENTGITLLEDEIQKNQILSSGLIHNKIRVRRRSKND